MSTIYKFKWDLPDIEVEAENEHAALKEAFKQQEQYSSSNDGSELLANASLIPNGNYECLHEETRTSTHKFSRTRASVSGRVIEGWDDMEGTYTYCKRCRKEVSKVEKVLRSR